MLCILQRPCESDMLVGGRLKLPPTTFAHTIRHPRGSGFTIFSRAQRGSGGRPDMPHRQIYAFLLCATDAVETVRPLTWQGETVGGTGYNGWWNDVTIGDGKGDLKKPTQKRLKVTDSEGN